LNKVTELSTNCVQWKSLAEALKAVGEFISKFGLNGYFLMVYILQSTKVSNKKAEKSAGSKIFKRINAEPALLQTSQPFSF
jgi:hypothetical protein